MAEERSNAEEKEVKRMQRAFDHEQKDKTKAQDNQPIAMKGLNETYEDTSAVKLTRGPFHAIESLAGLKNDDFLTCCYQDIIDAANTEPLRLLVTGKPRSGKSTTCELIAAEFDLVHVNVENWIAALLKKIKEYEPPEDLEEGQEPPKWLSDLEETINEKLKWGEGPT